MRIRFSFIVALAVVGIGGLWFSRGTGGTADNVLSSVDDGFLSEHFDLHVAPDNAESQPAVDREDALAAIAKEAPGRASAPVKEAVLATVRTTLPYQVEYVGRAWIVSLAVVPPFQGGPIPVQDQCLVPPHSKYTVENTFFIYLVDAQSGAVLRTFGGTLEPDTPADLADCTVVPAEEVPYEPR